jgi:demethylmenaquinone methyltransferase / 2-methoxy-6-polyprenyl-1,4-benzoquinol methylase
MPTRRPSAPKTFNSTLRYKFQRRPTPSPADGGSVRAMFDAIAPAYDRFNQWASLGLHQYWRKNLVGRIPKGVRVLDIATGTGDVAFLALSRGHDVAGIDFSEAMLARAREKDPAGKIRWVNGSATRLPFSDRSFGAITSAFALRNMRGSLEMVFRENFRVLKIGGKVLHMDFGRPAGIAKWGHQLHLRYGVPFIGQAICGSQWPKGYLETTIQGFYEPEEVVSLLQSAGFQTVRHTSLLWGSVRLYEGTKAS